MVSDANLLVQLSEVDYGGGPGGTVIIYVEIIGSEKTESDSNTQDEA
jgi:hypothetical protein